MPIKPIIKNLLFPLALGIFAIVVNHKRRRSQTIPLRSRLKYDGLSVYGGIKTAYRQLLHYEKNKIFIPAAVIIFPLILYAYDEEISNCFAEKGKKAPRLLKDFGWYFGSPENHYAITGGFYLYSLLANDADVRRTGVLLISATSAVGILQTLLKMVIGRARPLRNEGKASFLPFSGENSYYSFPSGHSILSFTTTYSIGKQLQNPFYKAAVYTFGIIAPFSRLWARAHWITDAVASLLISARAVNSIDNYLAKDRLYIRERN